MDCGPSVPQRFDKASTRREFEATTSLRARYRHLVGAQLPQAAKSRPDWPVRLDHCFARILLDTVCDRPWREVIPAPAWRNMDALTLTRVVALAEAVLSDEADLAALNLASLRMRTKPKRDGSA